MVYAILLDDYQKSADQYGVSYSGSLDYCDGQTSIPTKTASWAKSDYTAPRFVKPKSLDGHSGRIVDLTPRAGIVAYDRVARPDRRPGGAAILAVLAGSAALAVTVAVRALRRPRR